jgi:hypothetical protein
MKKYFLCFFIVIFFIALFLITEKGGAQPQTMKYLWITAPEFNETSAVPNSYWLREPHRILVKAQKVGNQMVFPPAFAASINLPAQATIKEIKVSGADSEATASIVVKLVRHNWMNNGSISVNVLETLESTAFNGYGFMEKTGLNAPVTTDHFYGLRLEFKMGPQTPNQASLTFGALRIGYTMP